MLSTVEGNFPLTKAQGSYSLLGEIKWTYKKEKENYMIKYVQVYWSLYI